MRQGAQGWCTGMTLRDGMGWGVQGGDTVHPWLIHVNVWQKPLQYCKVISLQLKKMDLLRAETTDPEVPSVPAEAACLSPELLLS